jgi:hypothetical protein
MLAHSELRRELTSILISAAIVMLLMLLVVIPAHSQLPGTAPKSPEVVDQGGAPVAIIVILIAQFVILVSLVTIYLSREAGLKPPSRARHPHWWQHIHVHH